MIHVRSFRIHGEVFGGCFHGGTWYIKLYHFWITRSLLWVLLYQQRSTGITPLAWICFQSLERWQSWNSIHNSFYENIWSDSTTKYLIIIIVINNKFIYTVNLYIHIYLYQLIPCFSKIELKVDPLTICSIYYAWICACSENKSLTNNGEDAVEVPTATRQFIIVPTPVRASLNGGFPYQNLPCQKPPKFELPAHFRLFSKTRQVDNTLKSFTFLLQNHYPPNQPYLKSRISMNLNEFHHWPSGSTRTSTPTKSLKFVYTKSIYIYTCINTFVKYINIIHCICLSCISSEGFQGIPILLKSLFFSGSFPWTLLLERHLKWLFHSTMGEIYPPHPLMAGCFLLDVNHMQNANHMLKTWEIWKWRTQLTTCSREEPVFSGFAVAQGLIPVVVFRISPGSQKKYHQKNMSNFLWQLCINMQLPLSRNFPPRTHLKMLLFSIV